MSGALFTLVAMTSRLDNPTQSALYVDGNMLKHPYQQDPPVMDSCMPRRKQQRVQKVSQLMGRFICQKECCHAELITASPLFVEMTTPTMMAALYVTICRLG
jgi:hypothetical protein